MQRALFLIDAGRILVAFSCAMTLHSIGLWTASLCGLCQQSSSRQRIARLGLDVFDRVPLSSSHRTKAVVEELFLFTTSIYLLPRYDPRRRSALWPLGLFVVARTSFTDLTGPVVCNMSPSVVVVAICSMELNVVNSGDLTRPPSRSDSYIPEDEKDANQSLMLRGRKIDRDSSEFALGSQCNERLSDFFRGKASCEVYHTQGDVSCCVRIFHGKELPRCCLFAEDIPQEVSSISDPLSLSSSRQINSSLVFALQYRHISHASESPAHAPAKTGKIREGEGEKAEKKALGRREGSDKDPWEGPKAPSSRRICLSRD
ncbi:uncharacterized protein ARMOST_02425 [Armillaria ostoyae]|uniref:Uncharacterized protein n=1 Tax=Armillaria ostoyae TaxID=47428 RepID=A0A284QRN5_ARMOS|nr:uncharacterized protein ARMOST_02425 [Armillaria ostoyae]